ncbi:MAG: GIY-YIG nuclease family protein [Gammaproteobacteria bacterium]
MNKNQNWYVYIVRCCDQTLYTGITTDVKRRVDEHNGIVNSHRAAKYTRNRQPVILAYLEAAESRSTALKREAAIKKLSKLQKELLIDNSQKT